MDGDAQASLDDLVNEVISRAAEVDDQGLRALTEAGSADAVPATKADGPGAFRLAELRATYDGVAAILDQGRLQELVEATNADTAERLATATAAATEAMAVLPDSVTASFDDIDALIAAQQAVMALRVLLATEVASELGVTMSFNDSDGDS
jgi:predicted lipoprotein